MQSDNEPAYETYQEDDDDQNERAGPGLPAPIIIRRNCVGEYLQRKGGYRLCKTLVPEPVAESGEQKRRRLSRNSRYGQQDPRKDPWQRGLQHYADGRPELADAKGQRGLA